MKRLFDQEIRQSEQQTMKNDKAPALARCFACRLPTDVRDTLHRERFENYRTLDELAQWLSSNGYQVSASSLRRHLGRHVSAPATDSTIPPLSPADERTPTPFDALPDGPVNECLVLEANARAILEKLKRTGATSSNGDLAQFLRLSTALERSLKQLQVAKGPMTEARRLFLRAVELAAGAVGDAMKAFMAGQLDAMRVIINLHLQGRIDAADFVRRYQRWEQEWNDDLAKRVLFQLKTALKLDDRVGAWLGPIE